MTEKENIIVPRWFLEVVEDTLRIQNNINLEKETGETCQDRNVKQSLNGIRKLLKGEELTGMERLEKLQPSLPSNLDEAAVLSANGAVISRQSSIDGRVVYNLNEKCFNHKNLVRQFKAGAEWMMTQVVSYDATILANKTTPIISIKDGSDTRLDYVDNVTVQIRKK